MIQIISMMKIIIYREQDLIGIFNYIIKDYQIQNLLHKKKGYIPIGGGIIKMILNKMIIAMMIVKWIIDLVNLDVFQKNWKIN